MKLKAKQRNNKNKNSKRNEPLIETNNYHIKKADKNNLDENKEKFDEKKIRKKLNKIYELIKEKKFEKKPNDLFLNITESPLVSENNNKILEKLSAITKYKIISPIEILYKELYEKTNKISNEKDKCSICQFNFYEEEEDKKSENEENENGDEEFEKLTKKDIDVILLDNCSDHFFHIDCIDMLIANKNNFKCPNCSKIYGVLIGEQPNGFMSAYISQHSHCSGFEKVGSIIINYHFPSGRNYSGTSRTAYLPNNKEGKEVLGLLKVCFDRKLTFIVGTSVTTGQTNTTVWNGIHHKTNLSGGSTYFGYPDKTYFNRVKEEMAAKGVIQENIDEDVNKIADDLLENGRY